MTIHRWSASTWVLASLTCLILLVGADQVRRAVAGAPKEPPPAPVKPARPAWEARPGVKALDFQLPDGDNKLHRLSDYKGQRIILTFFCGCSFCRDMAKQLATAYKESNQAPTTVAVFTDHWDKAGTPNFISTTGADNFTYLYAKTDPSIVKKYRGTPCPKVFVIDKNQTIVWRSKRYMGSPNWPNVVSLAKIMGLKYTPPKTDGREPLMLPDDPADVIESPPAGASSVPPAWNTTGK